MNHAKDGRAIRAFATRTQLSTWLDAHDATSEGLWIKFAKKGNGIACVGKLAAVELALMHGWIDGQLDRFDAQYWLVRFTPRNARSKWSAINCRSAEQLIADGLMRPRGLSEVEAAKADGRWSRAYEPASTAQVPDDLRSALDVSDAAATFFASLSGANRYAILYRIHDAKRPATRAARILKFITMLERGETIY